MKKAIVLYMPVLHRGYIEFLTKKEREVNTIFLVAEELVKKISPDLATIFERDLRAIPVAMMCEILTSLDIAQHVEILNDKNLQGFDSVVAPKDDELLEKVFSSIYPSLEITYENFFLRWGRKTILSERSALPDITISKEVFDRDVMSKAFIASEQSSDQWRQIGSIIFPLNVINPIKTFNHHLPHEQSPYVNGDTRIDFKPGEYIEMSTAIHAEASGISYAALKGIPLKGASIYVTAFPCPVCARLIAESGIKKVYYCEKYSRLDAFEVLRAAKVELVFVDLED